VSALILKCLQDSGKGWLIKGICWKQWLSSKCVGGCWCVLEKILLGSVWKEVDSVG
jgi:hypothetical protein